VVARNSRANSLLAVDYGGMMLLGSILRLVLFSRTAHL
jgi:hypothetical protein